jgi:hypothetical protein
MDAQSLGAGSIIGIGIWELGKKGFELLIKKKLDNSDLKRKLLREDIELIIELVLEIHESSITYYSMQYDDGKAKELSKLIKNKSKTVGMKISALNTQLRNNNSKIIDVALWTDFKKKTTEYLDVKRKGVWLDSDPRIISIYKSTNTFNKSLNSARYSSI